MGGHTDVGVAGTPTYELDIESMLNIGDSLLTFGLTDGGTAGLIWGFVAISIGFTLVFASIAEMASM